MPLLLPCPAMDYLWTPWRYAYVSGSAKTVACVFCEAPKEKDDAKARIVYRGQHCFVILNTYPYTPGHVMIVPYAHLDELQKLPREAADEMMVTVPDAWRQCYGNCIVLMGSIWG